jgi:antitoxin component HigA of HigAB toxin-antitoxin module
MVDVNKLKGKLVEKGVNVETLAKLIGSERSTLYRKLNNADKITVGEAKKMQEVLEIPAEEATIIFFG